MIKAKTILIPLAGAVLCGTVPATAVYAEEPSAYQSAVADSVMPDLPESTLDEIVVEGAGRSRARIGEDGSLELSAAQLKVAPRYFGEADLLRLLRSQGSVGAVSDYASGLSIDGMDGSSTVFAISGVPVHFPYHFGGIFSVFSSWQYPSLKLTKSIRSAGGLPSTGGEVEMTFKPTRPTRFRGLANLGLTASSVAFETPLGSRFSATGSARISYLDALYGSLLRSDSYNIGYDFSDVDLAVSYHCAEKSTLRLFGHYNSDWLSYKADGYGLDTRLKWHNALGGIEWRSPGAEARVYYTEMANRVVFEMQDMNIKVPSWVRQAGASARFSHSWRRVDADWGVRADAFKVQPQDVDIVGIGSGNSAEVPATESLQTTLWASASVRFSERVRLEAGLEADGYHSRQRHEPTYNFFSLNPRLSLYVGTGDGTLCLHAGRYRQYIHQTGFSEIGLPSNFKIASTRECPPEESLNAAVSYSTPLPWLGLRLNAEAYFKKLSGLPEYFGAVLDLLSDDYRPEAYISVCRGHNYGGSISLNRDFKALSASVNYSFGVARRRLPGSKEYFTASSETRHALNVSAAYVFPGNKWTVAANFAYATGRPITPVRAAYFIGQYLVVEYGKRNSARLPAYHRLDLSASRVFITGRLKHTISLSLINAYGHRNKEMMRYTYEEKRNTIRKFYISSLYRFLPSLSYTLELQ